MDFKFIFPGFHYPPPKKKNIFHFSEIFIIFWVFFCNFLKTVSCLHTKQSEIYTMRQTLSPRKHPPRRVLWSQNLG